MDITAKKWLHLLEESQPAQVRRSTLIVLGELGLKDRAVADRLLELLDDGVAEVRLQAIVAAGKLRLEGSLPVLLARLEKGGPEGETAAMAAARLGSKGVKALQDRLHQVVPGLRRYIAAALAAAGSSRSESAGLDALEESDPGVVDAAVRSFMERLPTLTPPQKKSLGDQVLERLKKKANGRNPVADAALVRLLAGLDDPRAEEILWERIGPAHPLPVRQAALQALGKWPGKPKKADSIHLLGCACERDFGIAAPALMLLKRMDVDRKGSKDWLVLLDAPDAAARRLGIEKLGDLDAGDVANALLKQLDHPDGGLRQAALDKLQNTKTGRRKLVDEMLQATQPERAWQLVRAMTQKVGPAFGWNDEVFAAACTHLEKDDHRAEPLLHLLRQGDPGRLRAGLEEKAQSWRKKKKYREALAYLRLLARDPAQGFPLRFELACCGVKLADKDVAPEARHGSLCLEQFEHLARNFADELAQAARKTKWLDQDDLFYVGFHLADRDGPLRKVGGQILEEAARRSPRTKLAQAAKAKLKKEGLA